MEHDEMCELPAMRKAFAANRVEFTDAEMEMLRNHHSGGFCWCKPREAGVWGPSFAEMKKMGHTAFNYIKIARQSEYNNSFVGKMDFAPVERRVIEFMEKEDNRPDAQVILVDFKNRKRRNSSGE